MRLIARVYGLSVLSADRLKARSRWLSFHQASMPSTQPVRWLQRSSSRSNGTVSRLSSADRSRVVFGDFDQGRVVAEADYRPGGSSGPGPDGPTQRDHVVLASLVLRGKHQRPESGKTDGAAGEAAYLRLA